jgi:hypothetical protein
MLNKHKLLSSDLFIKYLNPAPRETMSCPLRFKYQSLFFLRSKILRQGWWHIPVILALVRLRHRIMNLRPAWAIKQKTVPRGGWEIRNP